MPATPALRREQIKLQVALINPLMHVKGYAAPETKAATEQARLLIEQAEALGEPPEDPLLLFSVLYGFWVANFVAFNGDVVRELAAQFLALAEKQGATVPLMIGHRLMGMSLLFTGDIAEGRAHSIGRSRFTILLSIVRWRRDLAKTFGVAILSFRSLALWLLGYPEAALADADHALKDAREIGQAATLMYALHSAVANSYLLWELRDSKRATRRTYRIGGRKRCRVLEGARNDASKDAYCALTGKASDAVQMITSGLTALPLNRSNSVHAVVVCHIWQGPCGTRSIR